MVHLDPQYPSKDENRSTSWNKHFSLPSHCKSSKSDKRCQRSQLIASIIFILAYLPPQVVESFEVFIAVQSPLTDLAYAAGSAALVSGWTSMEQNIYSVHSVYKRSYKASPASMIGCIDSAVGRKGCAIRLIWRRQCVRPGKSVEDIGRLFTA